MRYLFVKRCNILVIGGTIGNGKLIFLLIWCCLCNPRDKIHFKESTNVSLCFSFQLVIIFVLSFLKRRTKLKLELWDGHPGLLMYVVRV